MRFEVLKRGTSYRRHEYLMNFYEKFSKKKFIEGLNAALSSKPEFEEYQVTKKNSRYYLTSNSSKIWAELTFSRVTDNNLVIFAVKRIEMQRERLNGILENLISGKGFTQQESQPVRNEQLGLFPPG